MTEETRTDEDLLRAAARGDEDAWAELFNRYQRGICAFLYRVTGYPEVAEDLTQETFLMALRKYKTFKGLSRFSTWLFAIALNLARSWGRQQARAIEAAKSSLKRPAPIGPYETLERKDMARRVRQAVFLLPEPQREALVLSRYHAFKQEEIAEILDCSPDAVRGRIFRAMETLRGMLRKAEW